MPSDRRFIEESFPVKEVGEASAREKSIRHGHISTLHIWWARRPLAASRATAYAALTPAPKDIEEWQKKRDFIIELSQWENSNNQALLQKARQDILDANGGIPPKVLDPFAGGGSYPLEALRLGCEAYANDYNPVAVLIEKATLEYPQKFGRHFEDMPEWAMPGATEKRFSKGKKKGYKEGRAQLELFDGAGDRLVPENHNPLLEAVRYWGQWVLEKARKELAEFYPPDPDGNIPVGYIWARTIPCQNPACGTEIPLMRQFWLAKKDKKKVALYPDTSSGELLFRVVGDGYETWPADFDPDHGSVNQAIVTCPLCGSVIDANTTRNIFRVGQARYKMIAVVLEAKGSGGKTYRLANMNDESLYQKTRIVLDKKSEELANIWGISPIPDEEIPTTELRRISLPLYGMNKWSDMHNDRQLLALVVLTDQIRKAHETIKAANVDQELAKAVTTYLAIMVNRLVDRNSVLCRVIPQTEAIGFTFARQALGMLWDYIEISPLDHLSGWKNITNDIIQVLLSCNINSGRYVWCNDVTQASATQLPYPENYFDAVLTDPPYYDNVPYSHLSDIFYVWLKRTVGYLYPELFSTPLTPKSLEIVQDRSHSRSKSVKTKQYFEQMLTRAFSEIYRVLKPDNPAIVVYAHKSTDGWETLINALLDSGLVMTGAWPLNTEFGVRLGAQDTASLASSIYIVARKMPRQPSGFYTDIRSELRRHLDTRLNRLWNEGIGGADFFIAAIGSAIEVFGKYKQVIDYEGNIVRADRLLEEVRVIATDYAVRQILHNGFATEISGLTRLYVLWRWNYGEALVPFDEGRKLAQSCGIDLAQEWGKGGFVKKEKEFIRLLGPQGRKLEDLDDPRDLIDVLHKALLLWEKGKRSEMVMALVDRDYGRSEAFYRVAQAISETLPNESKEKKLLDGFLAGRERVQEEVGKVVKQGRLWN